MALKIYNTLTRKKEVFKPIVKGKVGMYTCGPTVYWYQHIGNLRSYIFADILRKVLLYNNYKVKQVMNVTDVGHLTSDADEGEDKMEKAAKKEGKNAQEIANYYLKLFREDFKKLNISEPDVWCKATEHIKEQIELIKKLEKKGFTYKTKDGIYFDTSKLKDYGKLARLKKEGLQAGKRIDLGEKKNITDFALWKFSEKPGVRQQEWNSPWGVGFPGWHIECSAMSMKYLGENFDIHTGGEDHISVHHTNEIAQSEAATGKKFVNYWLHGAFLMFKGEKVSKSKGGLYTISELEEKGFEPLEYRYFVLTAHYGKPLNFSLGNLEASKNAYQRLKNIISEIKDDKKINKDYLEQFEEAIDNNLDMPNALQVLWKLVRDEKASGKYQTIKEMDKVFGLKLLEKEEISVPDEIKKLVAEREKARKNKEWKLADELREKINRKGYSVDDADEGARVGKV
ncbi:MAG: cysteine--tRNA ligase [Nanoarchaeota archaeon]|nr:cysteine--tRNA ligase [Nanoarchaeota archaeon]